MSDNTIDKLDKNKLFSGWYYDDQQNPFNVSRLTTVSLHSNAVFLPKATDLNYQYSEWSFNNPDPKNPETLNHYPYGNLERDNESFKDYSLKGDFEANYGQTGYFMEPLCTSIVNEDFMVSINNGWSEMGGDMVGGIWNKVKEYAPYVGAIAQEAGQVLETLGETVSGHTKPKEGETPGFFTNVLAKTAGYISAIGKSASNPETRETVDDYANRCLMMQGTRFSYYQGSSVNFGNLVMKFTIFPKWKIDANTGKLKFYTVPAQIHELYPYFMGEYKNEDRAEFLHSDLSNFIGWQLPPGGFRASIQDIDNVQRGTLKLKIGTLYSVSNLVVESCQFNFSKQVCKCPDPEIARSGKQEVDTLGLISPLYCEITLSLRPVTKYSSQSLRDFISGANMRYSKKMTSDKMHENLNKGLEQIRERYVTNESEYVKSEYRTRREERKRDLEEFNKYKVDITPKYLDVQSPTKPGEGIEEFLKKK
jgi:hypothetical protein